jgi:hypothetical protein
VTSAAVAAAIITPQVLSTPPHHTSALSAPAGSALANPPLPIATSNSAPSISSLPVVSGDLATINSGDGGASIPTGPQPLLNSTVLHAANGSPLAAGGSTGGTGGTGINAGPSSANPASSLTAPLVNGLGQVGTTLDNTVGTLTNTVGNLATTLGLTQVLTQLGLVASGTSATPPAGTPTTTIPPLVSSVTKIVGNTLKSVLGSK